VSRITYQDGRLYLHLTKEEIQRASEDISMPVELPIDQLYVFKDDIQKAYMAHWSKVEVFQAIREHQVFQKSTSKKKK
jgi:hypothetical protein